MSKLQGISGGMSGRTGAFTYRQSRGQTIVSQYQPIVKNPNTEGQQKQRARFKLMTQLAAVLSAGFGSFIIKTRPEKQRPSQRNAFVQINMPLVETDESVDGVVAKIPMQDVKLTSSSRILGEISFTQGTNSVLVTLAEGASAVSAVRFVVIDYIENDITRPVLSYVGNVNVSANQASLSLTAGLHTVLAYGLIPTASASKATLDNLHTPTDDNYFAAIKLANLVNSGELIETETIGVNTSDS